MEKIAVFYPQGHEAHYEPGHPERPERIETIRGALQTSGMWGSLSLLSPLKLDLEFIGTIHSPEYLRMLEESCANGERLDADTYTTPASWQLALNAAGGAVAVANSVWEGEYQRGLALTRPPGHHATPERGMGFCLLNNAALAAEYLLQQPQEKGANVRKLTIIDLDLHHGNGTQDIFWSRKNVFYISTHQSPLYPGTGMLTETGSGPGEGYTANFPLPPGTGDQGFEAFIQELILPILDIFKPEMLLVSVGFDPHWRDPLGHLLLSASGYGKLIGQLVGWADHNCDGKISLFLEGGYDLEAGEVCVQSWLAALLQKSFNDTVGQSPKEEGTSWQSILRDARTIWKT